MPEGHSTARHPIRVVARRTGLKADLIRAWERRYAAIEPERTPGGHRFYSDRDIDRLLLLRQATSGGRTIGQVAAYNDEQLRALVTEDRQANAAAAARRAAAEVFDDSNGSPTEDASGTVPSAPPAPLEVTSTPEVERCLDAVRQLDARALRFVLERSAVELGWSRVLSELVHPLMARIGELWHRGDLREVQEHLASFEIRLFVEDMMRRATPAPHGPRLVVTTPSGQRHEVGALMAAATAALEGWDVTFLGADLPAAEIAGAALMLKARAVALSLSATDEAPRLAAELTELRRLLGRGVPLLVGGQAAGHFADTLRGAEGDAAPAMLIAGLGELKNVLTHLRAELKVRGSDSASSSAAPAAVEAPRRGERRPLGHRELPLSREAAERFEIDVSRITQNGQLRLGDLQSVRRLVHQLNSSPQVRQRPEIAVRAGRLFALGMVFESTCEMLHAYRSERNPGVLKRALAHLRQELGERHLDQALDLFVERYPLSQERWVESNGRPDTETVVERLLLVSTLNQNRAAAALRQLYDDRPLNHHEPYRRVTEALDAFLADEPAFDQTETSLFDHLAAPRRAAPDSLTGQLEALVKKRGSLSDPLVDRMWMALDVLREEEAPAWSPDAPAPRTETDFGEQSLLPERREAPWMARTAMVAKNVLVWLHQLSAEYGSTIERLDQIPDAELDRLASYGFDALWLIGIWRRSPASQTIKRRCGQTDAVASAYAIDDYVVDDALGGEEARAALEVSARRHGLRLACDMVPNHMGLDSRWLIEHPERFLSVPERPFPSYTFQGDDLSEDSRVSLYLEDHYLDRSDAAVVFQRIDRRTGEVRFVYHGNDGTRLPWNDTAQLDYLQPATRQAVIDTILDLAGRFPILRLDAAMTLVKQHYRRLWFPEPGQGGAVPSRAGHGLDAGELDRRMPEELWLEVVRRIDTEAPDTLLLAEGFWHMEPYFIRELGMHRVYNSAFMHMLRDGDLERFQDYVRSALAVDPAMLGRFVNFLTNPDEATAVEQFGKGDRYFAVCTLLVTFPGLALFGHGQVEGMVEKYPMDADRPRYSEAADRAFVERHREQIAPLLAERALYAGTSRFRLWDVEAETEAGARLAHRVVALSNAGDAADSGGSLEHRLVIVHVGDGRVTGRLQTSARFRGGDGELRLDTLAAALGLPDESDAFVRFRDRGRERWHLRSCRELHDRGLTCTLEAWEARVFDRFELLRDTDGTLARVTSSLDQDRLGAEGVEDLDALLDAAR
ncbi:MAG: MerR family transcriptional regulator [Acidobacteriota bacterium]